MMIFTMLPLVPRFPLAKLYPYFSVIPAISSNLYKQAEAGKTSLKPPSLQWALACHKTGR